MAEGNRYIGSYDCHTEPTSVIFVSRHCKTAIKTTSFKRWKVIEKVMNRVRFLQTLKERENDSPDLHTQKPSMSALQNTHYGPP